MVQVPGSCVCVELDAPMRGPDTYSQALYHKPKPCIASPVEKTPTTDKDRGGDGTNHLPQMAQGDRDSGCPPGIRTPIACSRGTCPTIERGGNINAGGEGGIRTLGRSYPLQQLSRLPPSATRSPLQIKRAIWICAPQRRRLGTSVFWRRAWDSNPQGCEPGGFQDRCLTN